MKKRRVPYVNLPAQFEEERERIHACVDDVFGRGDFVGGAAIAELETELASFIGIAYVVALNSGTDALILGMKALGIGPGDEVITPPNSFVSSTAAIAATGATPVFADVLPDQNIDPDAVERAITPRTRAIMPVHLTGRMADMTTLCDIANRRGLFVIEDAAQSIGSMRDGLNSGAAGDIGCFSAHPLKNLNAAGDAGFLVTHDAAIAERVRRFANNGLADRNTVAAWGTVSRLDTLQAAILRVRLEALPKVTERRRANAALYCRSLSGEQVFVPPEKPGEFNTYHTFVVQVDERDALKAYLAENGIESAIHYPVPIHLQPAAANLGYQSGDFPVAESQAARILSLPVHQFLNEEDITYVQEIIAKFFANSCIGSNDIAEKAA